MLYLTHREIKMRTRRWIIFGMTVVFFTVPFSGRAAAGTAVDERGGQDNKAIPSVQEMNESSQILKDLRQIEYDQIRYDQEGMDYYQFIPGKIPILISAPHGARHFRTRENRWKGEEEYTSSLAIELGRLTGAHVIYVKNQTREDPNHDPTSRYKRAVAEAVRQYQIKFMLDLHGSDAHRPFKVDVGIISEEPGKSSCPTYKEIIRSSFSGFQPGVFNQKFCASNVCTMTSFARRELGIEAAQVEINARYRVVERKPESSKAKAGIEPQFKADPNDVLALVTRLKQIILQIDQELKNNQPAGFNRF